MYNAYNVVQLSDLTKKSCTTQFETFMNDVVRSLLEHCTTHCTTNLKYKLLYNIGQYVQYCTKPCTISFSNPFFGCTTFQIVYGVQPFVQYCTSTTYAQCCTILYRLYRLYNLLYNIVTVWFADVPPPGLGHGSPAVTPSRPGTARDNPRRGALRPL